MPLPHLLLACACVRVCSSGLFLLERLKPQLDLEVSQALARVAPLTTTSAAAAAGGVVRTKRSSRQQRAAWVRQRLSLLRGLLKQQLAKAELLVLAEGATVSLDSHAVLMRGSLQVRREGLPLLLQWLCLMWLMWWLFVVNTPTLPTPHAAAALLAHALLCTLPPPHLPQVKMADEALLSDPAAADVARWLTGSGRHMHQSILPWVWDVLSEEDLALAPGGWVRVGGWVGALSSTH